MQLQRQPQHTSQTQHLTAYIEPTTSLETHVRASALGVSDASLHVCMQHRCEGQGEGEGSFNYGVKALVIVMQPTCPFVFFSSYTR
eukprot:m.36213 g.36213  ORF g.36213 m.36213 type:complete len:86 (-) comp9972_c0_seq2:4-261(-)